MWVCASVQACVCACLCLGEGDGVGFGLKYILLALDSAGVETWNGSARTPHSYHSSSQRYNHIKLIYYDKVKNRALNIQPVRPKENPKMGHDRPSQRHAVTKPPIKALVYVRHAIKEETIAINRDWVYNQACRLSHYIHALWIYMYIPLIIMFLIWGIPAILLNLQTKTP